MTLEVSFQKGTYPLNDDPNSTFRLNRVIPWDGGRLEDVRDGMDWLNGLNRRDAK